MTLMEASTQDKPDVGWDKPTNATEALERGLEIARDEERWCFAEWAQVLPDKVSKFTNEFGALDVSKVKCEDVAACAAGILVIVCLDGPAVRSYLKGNTQMDIALRFDPVGRVAAQYLRCGLSEFLPSSAEWGPESDPINHIVHMNDRGYVLDDYDSKAHHENIVKGFERAVELSKQ